MNQAKAIEFHFSGGSLVQIETTEPEEIIQMVANQKDGWLQYDDIVINVRNVSYIKVRDLA
ncbi:hypothetical protein [Brevibacillus sp. SAFN-007a]|uniref:hypothetical protein n=1 Tax=Brevibacillus sp. SAFN-007a TaxID=3436862 RepID=UPI003F7DD2F4